MIFRSFDLKILFSVSLIALSASCPVAAEEPVLGKGDAVVTGFSGAASMASEERTDETFLDKDGSVLRILSLDADAPPNAQVLETLAKHELTASDVGQVFAITLDDGLQPVVDGVTPNIYLGATSAYGLHIVIPDADDDGRPERVKRGRANAEWMAGQFGPDGGPGSIWKVDGTTGETSIFATLPDNSGPGVGDIVYDTSSLHFYASDLDTGLIHRINSAGAIVDSFDHGVKGRSAEGLEPEEDDGVRMDIRDDGFDSQDPQTWGFTQAERRVHGLGLYGGRLFYAVAEGPTVWSVAVNLDGSFGDDPRPEFEVSGTPGNHPIADIAFDAQGMMYVAQRSLSLGSQDYTRLTEEKRSVVFRYKRELPEDPETPGSWIPVPDEVAVGFVPDNRNTAGGLALGYGYSEDGQLNRGACGGTLWATGNRLRASDEHADELAEGGPSEIFGLQGADPALVRPDNAPPFSSYFVNYASKTAKPDQIGHVGDVEIWQTCSDDYGSMPYLPPDFIPPSYYPDGYTPPGFVADWDYNLRIDKAAVPLACAPGGLGFLCTFTVRVTNTGPDPYFGAVTVNEKLPFAPAAATMTFNNAPPWNCVGLSPHEFDCTFDPAMLWPGTSIDLKVTVDTPAPAPVCSIDNTARLKWLWGGGDSNPGDDFAWATASMPAGHCPPVAGEKTNLKLTKVAWKPICTDKLGLFECDYAVQVRNAGGAVYNGDITIDEDIPAGGTPTFFIGGTGSCTAAAPFSCTFNNDVLNPGDTRSFGVRVKIPKNLADDLACTATNKAKIVAFPGGHDLNTDPTDDEAEASATLPGTLEQCPGLELSNLKIKKTDTTGGPCPLDGNHWKCEFNIRVSNFGKPYQNELVIGDVLPANLPAGTTVSFAPPGNWQCQHQIAMFHTCSSPNPNLGMGGKVDIPVTVRVPVKDDIGCTLHNKAVVLKAPAETAQNTFAGDDASSAVAQFSPVFPPNGEAFCLAANTNQDDDDLKPGGGDGANLSITKTAGKSEETGAGQNTPFTITVTNEGPGTFTGPIVVRETLPVEPSNGSWSAPWVCEGQSAAGHPEQGLCTHPATTLASGESVTLTMEMELPNSYIAPSGSDVRCGYTNVAEIVKPSGGDPLNTDASDDTAKAEVQFAPFKKHGKTFCGIDDLVTPPPASCPQGWSRTPVPGKCCPPNSFWNGKRCSKDDGPDRCEPKSCRKGQAWDQDSCSCVKRECKKGMTGIYPNCRKIIVEPPRECPRGTTGTYPRCREIPKTCPRGYKGSPPNCTKVEPPKCPRGYRGTPPNCKKVEPPKCPRGYRGTPPKCKKVEPPKCPRGYRGTPPKCKKVEPPKCPRGYRGTPPKCKKVDPPKCPRGYRGTPPKCKKVEPPKCPRGYRGKPPKCKKIVQPPRRCPRGMTGRPPNCKPIVRRCPDGFTGRPPRCRRIKSERKKKRFEQGQINRLGASKRRLRRRRDR